MKMVIEFGYVTLFASAFPLAAALSLVYNIIEIRSDLFKLLHVCRRPPPTAAAGIGTWGGVLQVITYLAVLTNAALFAFSSNQMALLFPSLFPRAAVLPSEHVDDDDGSGAGGGAHYGEGGRGDSAVSSAVAAAIGAVWERASAATVAAATAITGSSTCGDGGDAATATTLAFGIEHLVMLSSLLIGAVVPPYPQWVRVEVARRAYVREQAARQTKHEMILRALRTKNPGSRHLLDRRKGKLTHTKSVAREMIPPNSHRRSLSLGAELSTEPALEERQRGSPAAAPPAAGTTDTLPPPKPLRRAFLDISRGGNGSSPLRREDGDAGAITDAVRTNEQGRPTLRARLSMFSHRRT